MQTNRFYFLIFCSLFFLPYSNVMSYDEPSYDIVIKNEIYEIRKYSDRLAVETISSNQNGNFKRLFNYISGKNETNEKIKIIDSKIWENLLSKIIMKNNKKNEINSYITYICSNYNIDKKHIIKKFLNYIILNKKEILTLNIFKIIENLMHNNNCDINDYTNYFISSFQHELKKFD